MHPKLEALIDRQRELPEADYVAFLAREAAEADRALIELGLCTEKKVYFEGQISDADARELGFDQSEIVGGARMRYRVERTPLPLTAEERAIALKIYETRVREARERAKDAPPRRLRLEGRMCAEERYGRWNGIGQLFSWMGVALWVAGLVLGSAKFIFELPLLPMLLLFGILGMAPISSGALHDLYNDTAGNLRRRRAEAAEKPDD